MSWTEPGRATPALLEETEQNIMEGGKGGGNLPCKKHLVPNWQGGR